MTKLQWSRKYTPAAIRPMLRALAEEYPVTENSGAGLAVSFEHVDECGVSEVEHRGRTAHVRYDGTAQAARGVGTLLSGLARRGKLRRETSTFRTLGIMLDCSRNAVMTVAHLRQWLRRLALLGYDMVMLYTEDTYVLPGEPYFGYQRGAYTARELKSLDAYAAQLGIELVPCIQTLGHLAQILRYPAYRAVRDTSSVLLVDEEQTYALIEKMVRHWKEVCRTRRIHIGMDETHDLGRGRYMDAHGYRPAYDLFNAHLGRVTAICEKHGLEPMIWSDMYFRLGSGRGDYYDPEAAIPKQVIKSIPKQAQLVYWDYYHREKEFYLAMIQTHRLMKKEPLMASGIWTWNKYWHDRRLTEANAGACIAACREAGVNELFFTLWGDNGAFCDFDSAFAGMAYCAEMAYGTKRPSMTQLSRRFSAVCGGNYGAHRRASDIHGVVRGFQPSMWEDPIFETQVRTFANDSPVRIAAIGQRYAKLVKQLQAHTRQRRAGDIRYAWCTAQAFADRYGLLAKLLRAYRRKDRARLRRAAKEIPGVQRSIKRMGDAFRAMWLRHNKPFGMELIQARFGAIDARYRELAQRVREYLAGEVNAIEEWDVRCPPRKK